MKLLKTRNWKTFSLFLRNRSGGLQIRPNELLLNAFAFQGAERCVPEYSQGDALGWVLSPFRARKKT